MKCPCPEKGGRGGAKGEGGEMWRKKKQGKKNTNAMGEREKVGECVQPEHSISTLCRLNQSTPRD